MGTPFVQLKTAISGKKGESSPHSAGIRSSTPKIHNCNLAHGPALPIHHDGLQRNQNNQNFSLTSPGLLCSE